MSNAEANAPQAEDNSVTNPNTQVEEKNVNESVPMGRFKEVLSRAKAAEEIVAKTQKAEEARRQRSLEEKGEYETVIQEKERIIAETRGELESTKNKLTDWTSYEVARRQTLNEQLPEKLRKFTASMSLQEHEEYVTLHTDSIPVNANKADSSRAGTTARGDLNGYASEAEWAQKDPESYEKQKANDLNGIQIGYGTE